VSREEAAAKAAAAQRHGGLRVSAPDFDSFVSRLSTWNDHSIAYLIEGTLFFACKPQSSFPSHRALSRLSYTFSACIECTVESVQLQ